MIKMKTLFTVVVAVLFATGSAFAMMGGGGGSGGHMGGGGGHMGGGHMGGGMGSGMTGVGGMISGMMGNTMSFGYLDVLDPIANPDQARAAIQAFITSSNSSLQISELWEYGTAYKAEISDTTGSKAFDLIADKFTGAVTPEMGMSMMLNASYGNSLYNMPHFGTNLIIAPDQATKNAQSFLDKNKSSLSYTLEAPETYPGYYKFHTKDSAEKYGPDIMVNGYNGEIWMDPLLGLPLAKY